MGKLLLFGVIFGLFFAAVAPTSKAQDAGAACVALANRAVESLAANCTESSVGAVCYGHKGVEVVFSEPFRNTVFSDIGNRTALPLVKTVRTLPLDLAIDTFGAALIGFGVPSEGDQPVLAPTAVLLGDVALQHIPTGGPEKKTTFVAKIGHEAACPAARNQVILASPEGLGVEFSLNGAGVILNGVATLSSQTENAMTITVQRGVLVAFDSTAAVAGQTFAVVTDNSGAIVLWSQPRSATPEELNVLGGFAQYSGLYATFRTELPAPPPTATTQAPASTGRASSPPRQRTPDCPPAVTQFLSMTSGSGLPQLSGVVSAFCR